MRGKVRMYKGNLAMDRITPAYAGKSEYFNVKQIITKDHPRLCGEKGWQTKPANTAPGSPPPMRGKADEAFYQTDDIWDHPRLCGEKFYSLHSLKVGVRITPAYAGKS